MHYGTGGVVDDLKYVMCRRRGQRKPLAESMKLVTAACRGKKEHSIVVERIGHGWSDVLLINALAEFLGTFFALTITIG